MYYIENTVNEYDSTIVGYFETFEGAVTALQNCSDWYREKGTGRIYQIGFGLNKRPKLVYEGEGNESKNTYDVNDKNLTMFLDKISSKVADMKHGRKKDDYAARVIVLRHEAEKSVLNAWALLLMSDMFREIIGTWTSVSPNLDAPARIKIIKKK